MPKPKRRLPLIVWAKGARGESCLEAVLRSGGDVRAVILHPEELAAKKTWIAGLRERLGKSVPLFAPADPNRPEFVKQLRALAPDVFVLAGYGKILRADVLRVPRTAAVNLHGGKVPDYRGSSPMNWALIRGEKRFTLSVLRVDAGVDSGDVLLEKSFAIRSSDTIADLHRTANREFPRMLVDVLGSLERGTLSRKRQKGPGGYFPLRFAEDGLVIWDLMTAREVRDRIRALTDPYPGAHTYFEGRKIRLLSAELPASPFYGEPGRVYLADAARGFLVGAKDRALWITKAVYEKTGAAVVPGLPRYCRLATVALALEHWQESLAGARRLKGKKRS